MAVRRTRGSIAAKHSGPDADEETVLAEIEIVTDDETGEVSSRIKSDYAGRRATKMTRISHEGAKTLAQIQEQLRSEQAAIAHATRKITPILKPKDKAKPRKVAKPAPEDRQELMVQCPHCAGIPSPNVPCYLCDDDGWVPYGTKIAS